MNILSKQFTGRINQVFSSMVISALLLSAFPASPLLAASDGLTVNDSSLITVVDEQVNFEVSARTDGGDTTPGTYFSVTDNGGDGNFYNGTLGGECNDDLSDPDTNNQFSIDQNQAICYANSTPGVYDITIQLLDSQDGNAVGDSIEVEVIVAPAYFCKATGNGYHEQTLTPVQAQQLNNLGNGNGVNDGNIIPSFGDFGGENWDDSNNQALWNNNCDPIESNDDDNSNQNNENEEKDDMGTIEICKVYLDENDDVFDPSSTGDASFTIPGIEQAEVANPIGNGFPINDVTFQANDGLNTDLNGDEENDAYCVTHDYELGHSYFYGQEEIGGTDANDWIFVQYNDQFNTAFDLNNPISELGSKDDDNEIIISKNTSNPAGGTKTDRQIVLVNQYEPEVEPETPDICTAEGVVVSYSDPALQNNEAPVHSDRRNVSAIENGVAPYNNFFGKEGNDWEVSPLDFFSLGIEGELVYEFTDKVAVDTAGDDIAVWEITGGNKSQVSDEKAKVYLSENGIDFFMAGTVTGDGKVDISGTGLNFVKFVKLIDDSAGVQGSSGDGYDVDAITIIDGSCATEPEPTQCTVRLTSDDTNTVVEKNGAFAKVLDFIHTNWTESLLNADWIWGDQGPNDPTQSETQTFVNQFGWNGDVITDATLTIAADNSFSASLNGDTAGEDLGENNYSATQDFDVTSLINNGNNELSVIVENFAGEANPERNPAGLYYELVINGEGENCETPYVPEPEEPEYGPYCGDDDVSGWEQCEIGDEGCTDYCTLDNQCTDLRLAKITLEDTVGDSTSFDGTIYLGNGSSPIPNGTWFNFDEAGDDSFVDTANNTEGLAVQRDTDNDKLALAFVGGNGSGQVDIVEGKLETKGINLGGINESPVPGFKLEDGSGRTFDDQFEKDGNEGIDFLMHADTGNDAATVEIGDGEEYNCPACKATVEARVILNDKGQAGDGDTNEQIILGDADYTTVEYGEWFPISEIQGGDTSATMINDSNTVTNFDNPGDKSGLFVSREAGTVKVALYGKHSPGGNTNNEWIDARIEVRDAEITNFMTLSGNYKLENHPENNGVPSNDGYDEATDDDTGVDFKLWVDTQSDGFRFNIDHDTIATCEDDTVDFTGSLEITDPDTNGQVLSGTHTFMANYQDADEDEDEVFWAIRAGSCNGDDMVGNAPASPFHPSTFNPLTGEFETTIDMSTWDNGDYCLVVNPKEDTGADDLRETRKFTLLNDSSDENYLIDGYKYELLGGEETDKKEGWAIELYDGEGEFVTSTSTDASGYYYFWVPEGEYEVREVMQDDWVQIGVQDGYDYVYTDGTPHTCSFTVPYENDYEGYSEFNSIALFIDEEELNYSEYRCDFYNQQESTEPELYRISGVKWEDEDGDGVVDESEPTLNNWLMTLTNGDDEFEADVMTNGNGEYFFDVPAGTWTVTEEQQSGWTQTGQFINGEPVSPQSETFGSCTFEIPDYETESPFYTCSFGNQEDGETTTVTRRSGGSSGTRVERTTQPEPLVLGATTDAPQFCPFLTDYMQMGIENDTMEVMKLQLFLNIFKDLFGGTDNSVTGEFDATTDANVKAFQEHYQEEILDPWFNRGIVPHNRPTGFVYKTTLWKINSIVCPDSTEEPDFAGEDLSDNVDIN